jgi:hypothetical protein
VMLSVSADSAAKRVLFCLLALFYLAPFAVAVQNIKL